MKQAAFEKPKEEITPPIPALPLGWRILIRPYRPEKVTAGGVELPDEVLDNEEILTYCGQIIDMGNKAFTATTRSGIDMSEIEPKPEIGDWVIYGTYGGQKVRMKGGGTYILINDDAITAIVPDPGVFQYYL